MNYEEWFDKAVTRINERLNPGDQFELKKLFDGIEWDTLSSGEKKGFGRYFSNRINDKDVPSVQKSGEEKSHHTLYIKTN